MRDYRPEPDEAVDGEGGWSDGYKHSGAGVGDGEFGRHETRDVGAVDHDGNLSTIIIVSKHDPYWQFDWCPRCVFFAGLDEDWKERKSYHEADSLKRQPRQKNVPRMCLRL